jgi:hypothetical protein
MSTVIDRRKEGERVIALFAQSADLADRVFRTRCEARIRRQQAWTLRLRSKATRDYAAALRERFDEGLHPSPIPLDQGVMWFELSGILAEKPVWARWSGGRLRCHDDLMTQARLLVELGTVFESTDPPVRVEATVTGHPAAVMMTLARACDRVITVDFPRESSL